jgi:predicted Holliday junction resolvase-like endonuclease
MMATFEWALGGIVAALVVCLWRLLKVLQGERKTNASLYDELDASETNIRKLESEMGGYKSKAQSAHTTKGQALEKYAPYMDWHDVVDAHWTPNMWSFMGNPLDFIVWDWKKDIPTNLKEGKIVFIDVKTGKSSLTTKQRRIRDLIKAGNVEWREMRLK